MADLPKMKLVRVEPTEEMLKAVDALDRDDVIDFTYYGGMTGWDLSVASGAGKNIWAAMLAASAPLTAEELDGLCRKMWPREIAALEADKDGCQCASCVACRVNEWTMYRDQMSAFIRALEE